MYTTDALDPRFIEQLIAVFEHQIPFNHLLGLRVEHVRADSVGARLAMRADLVGHFLHQRLHGGVISAVLDTMGGLAVLAAIGARHREDPVDKLIARFSKLGTIDLRVDYLRVATGAQFTATANVMRLGSRVASTRMEFRDDHGKLLCTGSAAYIVS